MTSSRHFLGLLLASMLGNPLLAAPETVTTLADQSSLQLTIYNTDLALVRDQRSVVLSTGKNHLAIRDVSAQIRPETALLRSLSAPGAIELWEQNFNFDLLTPQKMLDKHVGKSIDLYTIEPQSGKKHVRKATLLSTNNGIVVRVGNRIETNPPGHFVFPSIPDNLRDKPTLVITLNNHKPSGPQTLELSYLTSGLHWQADYVATLAADDRQLDLAGWVTLTNTSGTDYPNARLQLVAGDVNQLRPLEMADQRVYKMQAMTAPSVPVVQQEALFEYHLYSLPRTTNLANQQTKQVALLAANAVPARKKLVLKGNRYAFLRRHTDEQKLKVSVFLEFDNFKEQGLGLPLPKGIVRVYKQDSQGHAQFIGEDQIDHTPNRATVSLKLGDSFDVTATRSQTEYSKQNFGHPYKNATRSSYRIVLENGKQEAVQVLIEEPLPHVWSIEKENFPHRKLSANKVQWQVDIAPESKTVLEYTVLIKY